MILLAHSYSPYTIMDIRFSTTTMQETSKHRVTRLVRKYALPEVEIKLLIAADHEHLDGYGRSRE